MAQQNHLKIPLWDNIVVNESRLEVHDQLQHNALFCNLPGTQIVHTHTHTHMQFKLITNVIYNTLVVSLLTDLSTIFNLQLSPA